MVVTKNNPFVSFVTISLMTGRAYGLNNTDILAGSLDIFPTGGLKDDYERKFYIAGVAILTVFVLFMVYGALHEVDEDIIDYDAKRKRKKERKRLRRQRRRLATLHPCEKRVYDVSASADDLLYSLRSQYGCKCLCTCTIHGRSVDHPGGDPTATVHHQQPIICPNHHDYHRDSANNSCEARRLHQSADPATKSTVPSGDVDEIDIWRRRQSFLYASGEFCIIDSQEFLAVEESSSSEQDTVRELEGHPEQSPDETEGISNNNTHSPKGSKGVNLISSSEEQDTVRAEEEHSKQSPDGTEGIVRQSNNNRHSSPEGSNEVNLISFPTFNDSPKRVASTNVTEYRPMRDDLEEVWHRRPSLEE